MNRQSELYAGSGHDIPYALVSSEGGKGALQAEFREYTGGSDGTIYDDSTFAIPAIYSDDYPDRYIHSNFDSAADAFQRNEAEAGGLASLPPADITWLGFRRATFHRCWP